MVHIDAYAMMHTMPIYSHLTAQEQRRIGEQHMTDVRQVRTSSPSTPLPAPPLPLPPPLAPVPEQYR